MGDRSPIILTERKKRRMAAKAKEEMKAQLDSEKSVDALDTLISGDNNNNNNNRSGRSKSFFLENKVKCDDSCNFFCDSCKFAFSQLDFMPRGMI